MNDKLKKIKQDLVNNSITAEQVRALADMVEELRKPKPVIPEEGALCAFSDDYENPLDDNTITIRQFLSYEAGASYPYKDTYCYEEWRYCIEVEPPRAKANHHLPEPIEAYINKIEKKSELK